MNMIVAVDENWAIGSGGDQLVYIPADLKRFQSLTRGHTVILGRKTLATFPGGRPLKGRTNLILSRNPAFAPEGAQVFPDLDSLLAAVTDPDAFVIGGASVYEALLHRCDTVYVTKIHKTYPADCYFPNLDQSPAWRPTETEEPQTDADVTFHYVTYRRV